MATINHLIDAIFFRGNNNVSDENIQFKMENERKCARDAYDRVFHENLNNSGRWHE